MAEQTNIQKPQTAAKKEVSSNVRGIKSAFPVIVVCFVVALAIFFFLLGNPGNFKVSPGFWSLDKEGPQNLAGTVFKGGVVVPVLITCFLTLRDFFSPSLCIG